MKICQECIIIGLWVKSTNTGQILIVKKLILHNCLVLGGRTPPLLDVPHSLYAQCTLCSVLSNFCLTEEVGWMFSVTAILWADDINSNSISGLILLIKTVQFSWFQLESQVLETIENQAIIYLNLVCFSERIKQVKVNGAGSGINCSFTKFQYCSWRTRWTWWSQRSFPI